MAANIKLEFRVTELNSENPWKVFEHIDGVDGVEV